MVIYESRNVTAVMVIHIGDFSTLSLKLMDRNKIAQIWILGVRLQTMIFADIEAMKPEWMMEEKETS